MRRYSFDSVSRCGQLALAALLIFSLGCRAEESRQTRLLLYCGAGIRPAAAELAERFGRENGVLVECDYAGSEILLSRIKLSGQGDLYMPGDVHYVEMAQQQGLVASHKTACYFVPVILVPKDNPKNIRSLADLTRPEITVGLGDPQACAIGRKSTKILAKSDIAEDQLNVKFRSVTVNELGNHVKLGMLDAVIVWDAVAAYFADDTEVVPIPRPQNIISTVAVAALESSEHPELALQFLEFAASPRGREVFQKHHYATVLPE